MPDANKEHTINQVCMFALLLLLLYLLNAHSPPPHTPCLSLSQLVGAAFGAAGQRCMALSTAIFVGKSQEWIPEIVERSKQLKTNAGEGGEGEVGR